MANTDATGTVERETDVIDVAAPLPHLIPALIQPVMTGTVVAADGFRAQAPA
ncbi:TPA: hypothetical protein ACNEJR_004680 [Escherichia coli]